MPHTTSDEATPRNTPDRNSLPDPRQPLEGHQTADCHPTEGREATPNAEFVAMADTPDYARLRSTFRNFAFPMVAAGLVSFFAYVLMSMYAVETMARPFLGMKGLNLGIFLGLCQFAMVYIWTALYVRFANNKLDATSATIKAQLEKGAAA